MSTDKRKADEDSTVGSDAEDYGPSLSEMNQLPKKRKVLQHEQVYLDNLPCAEYYERSYMHRDIVTHVAATKTGYILTASADGHLKFWKKEEEKNLEFVKHFRCHLGTILDMSVSCNGQMCCTISDDKTMKVFDIENFDMITMVKLGYVGRCCCWIYACGDAIAALAIAEKDSGKIYIYDAKGQAEPLSVLDRLHTQPVLLIRFNPVYEVVVSVDKMAMLEYWTGPKHDYAFPKTVDWQFKTDTDLYEFAKEQTLPNDISFSPDGRLMAALCKDRKIRIFKFVTGRIVKIIDEALQQLNELQQMKEMVPNMEFGRRMAIEKELERTEPYNLCNVVFDESGNFLLYATMLGIKAVNLHTNRCAKILGKQENVRFLHLSLFQGKLREVKGAPTVEMVASDNPLLKKVSTDPTLICTALKKNRFFLFTRRDPDDLNKGVDNSRDVFNEKPSKEELIAATQDVTYSRISDSAVIHTSMGDIHLKLFPRECPKTVENFCVHSRNGYYNGHIFHRIIKGFMIQTGDPLGSGTGGESIWGGEFEDEFHPNLRHDRPFTVSMANAGPNTNGSQFFITVAPSPWLDNKHTVFGRVVQGMETVQKISHVKTNSKTDKPYDDIRIINITVR